MMQSNKLPAGKFYELYEILMDKQVVEQSFSSISALVQKKFDKIEYVNGRFLELSFIQF